MERGRRRIKRVELNALLDAYGVDDLALRAHLVDLARGGAQRGWWARYTSTISPAYASYLGFESDAAEIFVWEPVVVHGLLQTEAYARAVIRGTGPEISDEELERRVEIRMTRQQQLAKTEPRLWAVLDESVLHRVVGSAQVMRGQLGHLIEMASNPRITIQVMPFARGAHPGGPGALTVLKYAEDAPDVIYAETIAGDLYPEGEEARQSILAYDHLRAAALDATTSLEELRKARERSAG